MVHEYIRESRDDALEEGAAGQSFSGMNDYIPPCYSELSLLSPSSSVIQHEDPLDWRGLPDAEEELPPYSFCARPYGRMFSEEEGTVWESDPREQELRLKAYFDAVEEERSLVFFYTNHGNPLLEETGERLLIGVARVTQKGKQLYFPKSGKYQDDYPLWSRAMTIDYPQQSVMLPYQEYIDRGYDTSNIICSVPESLRTQFSYVSEQLTDDEAVIALEALIHSARIVKAEKKSELDWAARINWLDRVLSEIWVNRGAYPGIGGVLKHLGVKRGTIYQRQVLQRLSTEGKDPLAHVVAILEKKKKPEKEFQDGLNQAALTWQDFPKSRKQLLLTLCRFELSEEQVDRVANPSSRSDAGIMAAVEEVMDNPYVLCEQDLGGEDSPPIGFEQIDHGMIPLPDVSKAWSEHTSISNNDKRRVRALIVDVLKSAAHEGDTLLCINDVVSRVKKHLPKERTCKPDPELIIEQSDFYLKAVDFDPTSEAPYFALPYLRRMEVEIKQSIEDLVKDEAITSSGIVWQDKLRKELGAVGKTHLDAAIEKRAQEEKALALEKMFTNRFSTLSGRAGTGKTLVTKILLEGILEKEGRQDILLLAPTGKARIKLQKAANRTASTIHQFLHKYGWIRDETYTLRESGGKQVEASTIIIDEASMIPVDLMGTLFRAIRFNSVKRLILIGDPNQLPPIGPGRPFIDILNWLDETNMGKKHFAYLSERARHKNQDSDAYRLSDGYVSNYPSPNDDEILSEISLGYNKNDLEVHFWDSISQLYEILNKRMVTLLSLNTGDDSYVSFNESLGISGNNEWDSEHWQILSPARMQQFGTREINRIIQRKFRSKLINWSRRNKQSARPFGGEELVWTDKVIQNVNCSRKAWGSGPVEGYVANGEVGYIGKTTKGKQRRSDSLDVRFATQPDITYRYYRSEVDRNLELAYAITVHKAQGSDFDIVFLILPQKARTLSRELLYTGLTRAKEKLVLLVEKDITPLKTFRRPLESATLLRNTHLFKTTVRPEDIKLPYPEMLIHRTTTGVMVRSKSEVVVANVLTKLGVDYKYEEPLEVSPNSFRLPDFTVFYRGEKYYWEHLGMLNVESYRKEWERKKEWYAKHKLLDHVITSEDGADGSIDSQEIERIAKTHILDTV